MNCNESGKLIALHAGGDLEPHESRMLEKHISSCPGCRELLEACRADRELVAALKGEGPEPPEFEEFWLKLKKRLDPEVRKRSARLFAYKVLRGITAAAVLLIAVTFLVNIGAHKTAVEQPERPPARATVETMGSLHEEVGLEKKQQGLELEECELCVDSTREFDF